MGKGWSTSRQWYERWPPPPNGAGTGPKGIGDADDVTEVWLTPDEGIRLRKGVPSEEWRRGVKGTYLRRRLVLQGGTHVLWLYGQKGRQACRRPDPGLSPSARSPGVW